MPKLGRKQADLYAAEHAALDNHGLRWKRLADAQVYLQAVLNRDWFFDEWPGFLDGRIERRGSGSRWSTCENHPGGGTILVADGSLDQPTILHELAHLLNPDSGHDEQFVATLLYLVHQEMGFNVYVEFLHALRARPSFKNIRERTTP